MRTLKNLTLGMFFVGALAGVASAQSQQTQQSVPASTGTMTMTPAPMQQGAPAATVDEAIDRMIAREHDEVGTIRRYSPIIETYIQDMKPDKDMGAIPVKDHYFLGQANLATGASPTDELSVRCAAIEQGCSATGFKPTARECRATLAGLNAFGRDQMASCMRTHCGDKGLVGCEAIIDTK